MEVPLTAGVSEAVADHRGGRDFLFTWKPEGWPHENLRRLAEEFQSTGSTKQWWPCGAHRKIHSGDRAYLLKQGKPIGIFGRGMIVGEPREVSEPVPGRRPWEVLIAFDQSRTDVLWDPEDQFLVDERQLLDLSVPKKQWQNQSSGITLEPIAARRLDNIIFESLLIGRGQATSVDEVAQEVARRNKLIEQWIRPDQQLFREQIRKNYRDKCAVTGCTTSAALEAAHISTQKGLDNNSPTNGILLRSDIHALFDRLLITLTEDGLRVEVSPELIDPSYALLKTTVVTRPDEAPPPSKKNIREHRNRFFKRLRLRSANLGNQTTDHW